MVRKQSTYYIVSIPPERKAGTVGLNNAGSSDGGYVSAILCSIHVSPIDVRNYSAAAATYYMLL